MSVGRCIVVGADIDDCIYVDFVFESVSAFVLHNKIFMDMDRKYKEKQIYIFVVIL